MLAKWRNLKGIIQIKPIITMVIMFDVFMAQGCLADKIKLHLRLFWRDRRNWAEATFINMKLIASLE